ncbi:MAG: hypothetical protein JWM80_2649, partial [Cyanobacteria bacterium RYN_339]|nr:hypothetical protein [Cyanobacteria bacterium RYN_339]
MKIRFLALPLLLSACAALPAPNQPLSTAPGVAVWDGGQVAAKDAPITLATESPRARQVLAKQDFGYDIRYVAQILPVTVNGRAVQANAVTISGDRAYVAYNTAGEAASGAIQIVDIADGAHPRVLKEIRLDDMEVDSLYLDAGTLYFGGNANPDKYHFHAFIGKLDPNNVDAATILASVRGLRSYVTTAIARSGGKLVAAVGAKDGGLEILNDLLAETSFLPRGDVRDLVPIKKGVAGVAGSTDTPGAAPAMFTSDLVTITESKLPGAPGDYAKATIEVPDDKLAFLGLSGQGLRVVDLDQPTQSVFTLANPSSSGVATTNAVSTDNDLAFVANGEYGFRVLALGKAKDPVFATVAGYHQLTGTLYDNQQLSVNYLKFKGQFLFAAVGAGGVNV